MELIVLLLLEALDPFDSNLREAFLSTASSVGVTLIEGKHLFFFGFKFAAKFSSLEDLLSQSLILSELVHAHLGVESEISKAALLVLTELDHLFFEVMVVLYNHLLLLAQLLVSLMALSLILLDF